MNLDNVTLICADDRNPREASQLLAHLNKEINFKKTKLFHSQEKSLPYTVSCPPISDIKKYNSLLLWELEKHIDTEFVMIVQLDGYFFDKKNWKNEFLNYDYIGAPHYDCKDMSKGALVGNGGFSIRSKKLLLETRNIISSENINHENISLEDWFICEDIKDGLTSRGVRFSPKELAFKFSIQGHIDFNKDTFGFHGRHTFTYNNEFDNQYAKQIKLFDPRITGKKMF